MALEAKHLKALVAICPVGSDVMSPDEYSQITVSFFCVVLLSFCVFTCSTLSNLQLPILIIHGELDRMLGYNAYEAMKTLPKHWHVAVAGAPHAVFQRHPNAFHTAALAFMHRVTE